MSLQYDMHGNSLHTIADGCSGGLEKDTSDIAKLHTLCKSLLDDHANPISSSPEEVLSLILAQSVDSDSFHFRDQEYLWSSRTALTSVCRK